MLNSRHFTKRVLKYLGGAWCFFIFAPEFRVMLENEV